MKVLYITASRLWLLMGFFGILVLSSCAEDGVIENEPQIFQLPVAQELVSATLSGRIIDETDQPIMGARVSYLSGNTNIEVDTDEYGNFLIEDVTNKGKAAFISVTYLGKFEAFRKFSLVPNRYNYTEVKMLDRQVIGSIEASEGGRLTMNNRSSIELPKDGIVTAQGAPYAGDVAVAMTWIDPSADDLAQRMIGDLSGLDQDGSFRSLSSMGMLQVELSDAAGNELNIGLGETAELKFPIPSSLMDKAESTIPLWSYNEDIGTWIQEGTANKEGDFYVGSVSHFSSWNVDFMTDPIEITGKVLIQTEAGEEGTGSYLQIYVCSEVIGRKGGWLCDDGSFSFYNFPKGEKFSLKVLDRCGGELFNETFGPFQNDEELGDVSVIISEDIVDVKGTALTCDGEPVVNGSLSVRQAGRNFSYPIDENGVFDFTIDFCDKESAILELVDLDALFSKEIVLSNEEQSVDVGALRLCDELNNFALFQVDGREANLFQPISIEVEEVDDSFGGSFYKVEIFIESNGINSDSIQEQSLQISLGLDAPSLELQEGILISFLDGNFVCNTIADDFPVSDMNLTEVGVTSGSVIAGTFSTTTMTCLDWLTGEAFEGLVVTGGFSVTIE